jgi:uncharacterized protein
MGSKYISLNLPVEYSDEDIRKLITNELRIVSFAYDIDLKSLDARQAGNIHWQVRLLVTSEELKNDEALALPDLEIPFRKRSTRVAVVGSGPAGFFAAEILLKAGFVVTVLERGAAVEERAIAINRFEKENDFLENANYAFGEGGAGTFSDGKLTSRTKGISVFKNYVLKRYVEAGAPEEIRYLSKPHIGSNNLRNVIINLRKKFLENGGEIFFNTMVKELSVRGRTCVLETSSGSFEADIVVWATGHSAYDSFRILIKSGVQFEAKPFALGVRVEHDQQIINRAMWRKSEVKGLKAAEYTLRWQGENSQSAYSFCMCPGGKVVQASPRKGISIVNGMSNYLRNSPFANSAIVVPVQPSVFRNDGISALEMIERIEEMENRFWQLRESFAIPANVISYFVRNKTATNLHETTYSHGIFPANFSELFPGRVALQLQNSLQYFSRKIEGFDEGLMMGLESKTSCAVQVVREENNGPCAGFGNVYVTGEGSGFSGGIISSAVDGIKTALNIIKGFV